MQLTLSFLPPPAPRAQTPQWNELDPAARAEAVEILGRLIAKAVEPPSQKEGKHHEDRSP